MPTALEFTIYRAALHFTKLSPGIAYHLAQASGASRPSLGNLFVLEARKGTSPPLIHRESTLFDPPRFSTILVPLIPRFDDRGRSRCNQ